MTKLVQRANNNIIIQSDCSIAIYKCFSLFMFWVVSDYANPKLKDKQKENLMEKLQN